MIYEVKLLAVGIFLHHPNCIFGLGWFKKEFIPSLVCRGLEFEFHLWTILKVNQHLSSKCKVRNSVHLTDFLIVKKYGYRLFFALLLDDTTFWKESRRFNLVKKVIMMIYTSRWLKRGEMPFKEGNKYRSQFCVFWESFARVRIFHQQIFHGVKCAPKLCSLIIDTISLSLYQCYSQNVISVDVKRLGSTMEHHPDPYDIQLMML